jgi:2',3'-cyclic-nucleotide 2'-phosphodiesterase (5'-nucleotidase family)
MMRRVIVPALAAAMVLSTTVLPAFGQDDLTSAEIVCPDGAPDAGFTDVPSGNVHSDAIDCGVDLGLIFGLTSTTFGPQQSLTRGQQVSLLARAMDEAGVELPPLAGSPNFRDIGPPHGNNIRRMAAAGIAQGYADNTFRTGNPVSRDQTASFFIRALEYIVGEDITPDERNYFSDVRDGVHAANIDAAFEFGIMNGKTDGRFDPRGTTRRDQAATVLINFLALLFEYEGDATINLLHDTHTHGKYVQTVGPFGDQVDVDVARYFALVEELKENNPNSWFLANGDDIGPSVYSGLFEPNGIHMIDVLNEAPLDVNTFGNHEFDYGPDNLLEIIGASDFPWVTANVRDVDTGEIFGADLGVEEFLVFNADGVRVGVTGLAPENMATITSMGDDVEQIPAEDALDIVLPKMQAAGVDVYVVTSHLCGSDAKRLADEYDNHQVHLYAGDHCAVFEEEMYEGETGAVVSLLNDEYEFLGDIEIEVVGGEVVDISRTIYTLRDEIADLEPIAAMQAVVDDYDEQLDEELGVVIGERAVDWVTTNNPIRRAENAAGNFFTDQMRLAFGGSDIAVTNSGGIRGNQTYPAGEITRRDIAEIFPFGNRLVQAEIRGDVLLRALERSVQSVPNLDGGFLQVSGIEMTFDSSLPAGSRVLSVEINGEPLVPGQTYTMATNDFTLNGGDNYPMFRDETTTLVDYNAAPVLDSYIIDRIENHIDDPITTTVEGRIVDLND